jgi:hypothetical protein
MPEKIRLDESMAQVARAVMSRARFSMPGIIRSYDPATFSCSVQPAVAQADGTPYPVIPKLPVGFLCTNFWTITAPPEPGDPCWILFAEFDVDAWLHYGQIQAPRTERKWAWNDGLVLPIHCPYEDAVDGHDEEMVIGERYIGMRIRMTQGSRITIGNEYNGIELLDLIDQLLAALQTATVNTAKGPQPLDPATLTTVSTIRSNLQIIKGSY